MTDYSETPRVQLRNFVQIGAVVRDLDRTMKVLSETFGIGPFREVTWPIDRPDMQGTYRGQPSNFKFREAFVQIGSVELEIIQPLEGDNIYSDFLKEHGEGLHHLRFDVDNLEDLMAGLKPFGIEIIQSGTGLRPGSVWAYLDTQNVVGFTVEVLKRVPGSDGLTPVPPLSKKEE